MYQELFDFMTAYGMSFDLAVNCVLWFMFVGLASFAILFRLFLDFGDDLYSIFKFLFRKIVGKRKERVSPSSSPSDIRDYMPF